MDLTGAKKKTDRAILNPTVRNEARRYSVSTRLAFLPDKVVGQSWFFRLLTLFYYYTFIYYHGFESRIDSQASQPTLSLFSFSEIVIGAENLDRKKGALLVARHSSHNGEILGTIVALYHQTGRVTR